MSIRRDYLTRHGKRVRVVCFFDHTADVLHGRDEGRQLGGCEVRESGYDAGGYDEDVFLG